MQQDLTDAVGWAVKEGFADEKRVAIMGGSYGGAKGWACLWEGRRLGWGNMCVVYTLAC